MSSPRERILQAIAIHAVIHLVLFTVASWIVLSIFLGHDLVGALISGTTATLVAILVEWLVGPTLVSSFFQPRWVERGDDVVLWSLVDGVAEKADVKVAKVGVLDVETPNALTYVQISGRPTVLLTKGLLVDLTFPEVRAVVAYLLGCSKSGVLGVATALSGLLALSNRIAAGYIESRLEGRPSGLVNIIRAGWGYLIFALTYPQASIACRVMSEHGDEFSILQTRDVSSITRAFLKVAAGLASKPSDPLRRDFISLKGLMFLDPTSALRGASALEGAAKRYGFDLERLLGHKPAGFPTDEELEFHLFEKFTVQTSLADRLERVVELGKEGRSFE